MRIINARVPMLLAAAAVLLLGVAAGARAHLNVSDYTRKPNCPATPTRVDPINVIFYGRFNNYATDASIVDHGAGFWNTQGSQQSEWTHGHCLGQKRQRADDCGTCNRFHLRFFANWDRDKHGNIDVVSDAHHDQVVDCPNRPGPGTHRGHRDAPHGPNEARRAIRDRLRGGVRSYGLRFSVHDRGNNRPTYQCTKPPATSDGRQLYIRITPK
jgi:hypothetical protein